MLMNTKLLEQSFTSNQIDGNKSPKKKNKKMKADRGSFYFAYSPEILAGFSDTSPRLAMEFSKMDLSSKGMMLYGLKG